MATQWPIVHARVVALMRTFPGLSVLDGPPVTGNVPTAYATVGYALLEDSAGDFSHEPHSEGWGTTESGTVRCELVCTTGGTDLAGVRKLAFKYVDLLMDLILNDPTLGVLPAGSTSRLVVDVLPRQDQTAAQQRLALSVEYVTIINS